MTSEREAKAILEAIRDYKPPKKLHPIAGRAIDLYFANGSKIPDEVVNALRQQIQPIKHDLKELTDVLWGLSQVIMYFNENEQNPDAAARISELVKECRPQYAPLGEKLVGLVQDFAKQAKEIFGRFADQEEELRAPKVGDQAPDGAVPLSRLKPMAKRPPPVNKKKE